MKITSYSHSHHQDASALLCALGTIVVLSIVGATVLMNSTTRYNGVSSQVKGWKEALYAAEAGGDIAYNAIRLCNEQLATDPSATCSTAFRAVADGLHPRLPRSRLPRLPRLGPSVTGVRRSLSAQAIV